ncbi:MAG: hypothetical protein AAF721_07855 [Myxococcota bacterium]
MKKLALGIVVIGALAAFWVLYLRFAVEGGRAPWAVINGEHEVLAEEIRNGAPAEELKDALSRGVQRSDDKAVEMLLAAGVSPNPDAKGHCMMAGAARYGEVRIAGMLLEGGADPGLCDVEPTEVGKDLVVYGHGDAPEAELVWALSQLVPSGADYDATQWAVVRDEASKRELPSVVAFFDNPGAVDAQRPNLDVEQPKGKPDSLELDDLKEVCEEGKGLPDAAPYVLQEGAAAMVYYFERRKEKYRWPGRGPGMPSLPKWWTSWDDPSHTQLVACVDVVDSRLANSCRYEGDGGGISAYDATFELSVYEAKTGTKVATKRLESKPAPSCPVVKSGSKQEGLYPTYSDELREFLAPHVGGPQ